MEGKYIFVGGAAGAVLILLGVLLFQGKVKKEKKTAPTPSPTAAWAQVEKDVEVILKENKAGTEVTLKITGLKGRYAALEYELNYDTDLGPKGTLSGSEPVKLEEGQDEFVRKITLGTCSTGGRCTYHKGVRNFSLVIKFYSKKGEVKVFQKKYNQI